MGISYIDFGIASLSAFLKLNGHKPGLIDFTFGLKNEEAIRLAKKFNPDLICFSSRSNEFEHIVKTADLFKREFKIPIICGGIHPTIDPEDALRPCFDGICIGEGEEALLDLVNNLDKDYLKIKNFWFNHKGKTYKNPLRQLIKNIDELPPLDYDLFDMAKYLKARDGQIDYIMSRGCPFNCSYCVNHVLQELYKGNERYVRLRSIDKVIEDLKKIKEKYEIKNIYFIDEIFNISKPRLKEFSEKYSKEINLPFECCARADLFDEESMQYMKKANCSKLSMAIESGDERLRKNLLNKIISDEKLIQAFHLARKYKIHTMSFNMIGLPYETPQQIEKTIELNRKAKPDSIQVSTFIPFKGTELYNFCKTNNLLLESKLDISYYLGIYLKNPNLSPRQLDRCRKIFSYKCYKDRSKIKAVSLLFRDILIPYYLKYGIYIPLQLKKMIYYLFWNTKMFKFMGK